MLRHELCVVDPWRVRQRPRWRNRQAATPPSAERPGRSVEAQMLTTEGGVGVPLRKPDENFEKQNRFDGRLFREHFVSVS
jgi:hypothetical protein